MNRNIRQTVLPLLAALIWGFAFSAQSVASDHLGPFAFNFCRGFLGFLALLILDLLSARLMLGRRNLFQLKGNDRKQALIAGAACGTVLFLASNMQQLGMTETSAGKAGFITAMYIVIVPLFGLLRGKHLSPVLWCSVAIAVAGLYFLCVKEDFSIVRSDFYVFVCAILFAVHILVIDHFTDKADGIHMSCIQFLMLSLLSGLGTVFTEDLSIEAIVICAIPLLYSGIFSGGIGYTLQILAQKDANPTVVSLLLSLESVFAVLGGALLLHETMGSRELLGCALMMVAVILSQLPIANKSAVQ